MWQFLLYPDGTADPWATWYSQQDNRVRATHNRVIGYLKDRERYDWKLPYVDKIEGVAERYEIRIRADVQHRFFGFFCKNGHEFFILVACTHKGKRYKPTNALDTANARLKEIKGGKKTAIICQPPQGARAVSEQRLS